MASRHEVISSMLHGQLMQSEYVQNLVSVIVPTYNRARTLVEALDSVYAQTYRPVELIVIDDGSTDDTGMIVEAWFRERQGDNQFELRYHWQENSGAPAARNKGLVLSRGEYILFLDSDDVLYPNMLAEVVKAFEETRCDYVHVGYDKICCECGRVIYSYTPEVEINPLTAYMRGNLWGHTTTFIRRRGLVQDIGPWDEARLIDQDGDYMVRTILQSPNMAVVPEKLFSYRMQSGCRINDLRGSREAWECRLQREAMFCKGIRGGGDLSLGATGIYAERLYELAVGLTGSGMSDIGDSFGVLAGGFQDVELGWRGKLLKYIWKSGKLACQSYVKARKAKKRLRQLFAARDVGEKSVCPVCGG